MNLFYYISRLRRIIAQIFIRFGGGIPDKPYLQILYNLKTGRKLDLNNPQTYNEKLQWLKLYDRNPLYTKMVDKYAVKEYVSDIIGVEHVIPTLGVWDKFEEIDFDLLPDKFVLKTTHDSGGVVICKHKKEFNIAKAEIIINKHLERNFYCSTREWPYKNVWPRIIAEKYMVDESGFELKDYKVFVFNGVPKLIEVDYGRFSYHKRNIYNTDWELLSFEIQYPNDLSRNIKKPAQLDEMLVISSLLSKNIAHVRVDFYVINNKTYFGELTFYHGSGYELFLPEKWNYILGQWLTLPCLVKNKV
jgi:hypothetical protein